MGIQDVIRFFLPREEHFYDFLEQQAKAAHAGALAISRFARRETSAQEAREAVQKIEHEGDKIVHEMEEALATTFVTSPGGISGSVSSSVERRTSNVER